MLRRATNQTHSIAIVLAVFALILTSAGGVAEAQEASGHKKTDKLIYRARLTTIAIRDALTQVQTTMDGYNSIIDGKASDNRAAYKSLVKDISKSESAVATVSKKAESMRKAAGAFFTDWEESLAGFNSEEMREKSEVRMIETRANYDKIFEAGSQAGDLFDAFISNMDDQVRFLGNALNPTGIADLQDEAEVLNADAKDLDEAINETIKVASRYANSLEPK